MSKKSILSILVGLILAGIAYKSGYGIQKKAIQIIPSKNHFVFPTDSNPQHKVVIKPANYVFSPNNNKVDDKKYIPMIEALKKKIEELEMRIKTIERRSI